MNPTPTSEGTRSTRLTGLFTKRPVPGRAKTRLAPVLGMEGAAALAEAMLADGVERCAACAAFRTVLWFAPGEEADWFAGRFPDVVRRPQHGPDLGQRLAAAFRDGLALPGVRTQVVVGSDQPTLSTGLVVQGHGRLESGADLVLAPDPGGGYALVGLRAPLDELFTAVEMSTDGMCAATVALARERGLAVELLPETLDVDEAADLERLAAELRSLAGTPEFPHRTARVLRALRPGAPDSGPA